MNINKIRIWIANKLVKLAVKIRPKKLNQMMQAIENSFIFGTGIKINPKEFYKEE